VANDSDEVAAAPEVFDGFGGAVDLVLDAHDVPAIDLEAGRAVVDVLRREHMRRLTVAHRENAAALVRDVITSMSDDFVEQRPGDPHGRLRLPTRF
jgi:hypothetical protein